MVLRIIVCLLTNRKSMIQSLSSIIIGRFLIKIDINLLPKSSRMETITLGLTN